MDSASGEGFGGAGEAGVGAGHEGNVGLLHVLAGLGFGAQHLHRLGRGADEDDSGLAAGAGELRVLGEESVAGMDGFGSAAARGFENPGNVEVGLGCLGGAEVLAEIGLAHVESTTVYVGVDRDRLDAHLATGTNDANRNLAAIGDEDSLEHKTNASLLRKTG